MASATPSVIVLARHFPPAISGGSRRPAALVRGLRELGCRAHVISPDGDGLNGRDGTAVRHPQRDPNPGALNGDTRAARSLSQRSRDFLREHALLPDPDIRWSMRAVRTFAADPQFVPDAIISTSPPESVHVAAAWLAQRFGAKLLLDFRDHWLTPPLRPGREVWHRRWREKRLARRLLPKGTITCTEEKIAAELTRLGGERAEVLRQPILPWRGALPELGPGFHIVHTGSFSLSDPARHIGPALDKAAELALGQGGATLHLAGRLTADEAQEATSFATQQDGLSVLQYGALGADEATALQRAADALLLVTSPFAQSVPGKFFEYQATGKPIHHVGSTEIDARLPELKAHGVIQPKDFASSILALLGLSTATIGAA